MDRELDIEATYTHGVLRPDGPLELPENARVRVTVHQTERAADRSASVRVVPTAEQQLAGDEALERLARRGVLNVGPLLPTREQLYDRF
jgi:predicted DNA-binding antitoxin AbrB/MazE fold protein